MAARHLLAAMRIAVRGILAAGTLALVAPGCAAAENPWPFDPLPTAILRQSPKKVFAHYFTPYPLSIDNRDPSEDYYARGYLSPDGEKGKHSAYGGFFRQRPLTRAPRPEPDWFQRNMEDEVRMAVALGLDGFACDILSTSGYNWDRLLMLLDAAQKVDPGFKIMLMPDMEAAFKNAPEKLVDTIRTLAAYPSALRMPDGKLVVAPFNAHRKTPAWWKEQLDALRAGGIEVAFVPLFQGWARYAADFAPISAGMSDWGPRWPSGAEALREVPSKARQYAPIWMMPVAPQDMRPKSFVYWEAANSLTYRTMWQSSIEGGADWVHLITWNDYSEASEIVPSSGTQHTFYDLTAYYTAWFKTGTPPKIARDVLYYFHRTQPTTATFNTEKQARAFKCAGADAPRDEVELLAFLRSPGTLEIELAGETSRMQAGSGVTSFRVPLKNGRPIFRLLRDGKPVITTTSRWEITDKVEYQDLLYRGGSSSRER